MKSNKPSKVSCSKVFSVLFLLLMTSGTHALYAQQTNGNRIIKKDEYKTRIIEWPLHSSFLPPKSWQITLPQKYRDKIMAVTVEQQKQQLIIQTIDGKFSDEDLLQVLRMEGMMHAFYRENGYRYFLNESGFLVKEAMKY